MMDRLISEQEALDAICKVCEVKVKPSECRYRKGLFGGCKEYEAIKAIPSAEPKTKWIPIKTRQMTEEEKEEFECEYPYMYDCPLPDDGQDVFVTDCYGNVEVDTFCRDSYEGCYFETNCDDGEVLAWMPLPEPYKAESEE